MSFQFGSVIEDLLLRLQKSDLYPVSADESSEWLSDRERRLVSHCYGLLSTTRWTQKCFCF